MSPTASNIRTTSLVKLVLTLRSFYAFIQRKRSPSLYGLKSLTLGWDGHNIGNFNCYRNLMLSLKDHSKALNVAFEVSAPTHLINLSYFTSSLTLQSRKFVTLNSEI